MGTVRRRSGASSAHKPVLVVGGGVAGQRAALDLAHAGLRVILLEKSASLGGTVAQLGAMFPLHNCLLCRGETRHGPGCTRPTISSELLDRGRPDGLEVWTQSRVIAAEGGQGGYRVSIRRDPRRVDPALCISCGRCAAVCPQSLPDPFQAGLVTRKAAYIPSERAVPDAYAVDKGPYCEECGKCVTACPTAAISLDETPRTETVTAGAVVIASGMRLSDPSASREYGYGRYPNVYSGLEMERMCSPAGPGEGLIRRRSDGKAPERIAWLQCVGLRDKARDYCSAFCCGYATRQAVLARRILPSAGASIYMMDDRVFAKGFGSAYDPLRRAFGVRLERCRPSVIREDAATRDLLLQIAGDDGRVTEERFGMVVLSIGAAGGDEGEPARLFGVKPDAFGFVRTGTLAPVDTGRRGIFMAGASTGPADIADSVTQGSAAAARVCSYLGIRPSVRKTAGIPITARTAQGRRIGFFACDCAGEIGGVLDLTGLTAYAAALPEVAAARTVAFGCMREGLDEIKGAVRGHGLTDVIIGACNRRTYAPLFERSLQVEVALVSLREECAYVHRDDSAAAARKARELARMAIERARRALKPAPRQPAVLERSALVIGGGLAGLTAALHLADAGITVHLVEREARLGGTALRMDRTPEGKKIPDAVGALAARAKKHLRVTVYASSEVVRSNGHAGEFAVGVRMHAGSPREETLKVGAILAATGGEEYRGPAYGLGGSKRVITALDMGELLRKNPGLPAGFKHVVFIGCVGPWDEPGSSVPWRCSRGCCRTIMTQALAVKEANPACGVTVLAREVNAYGFGEETYTSARKAGVLFVRFDPAEPPRLAETASGLRAAVRDQSLNEILEFGADLAVLAAAVMPRTDSVRLASALRLPLDSEGFPRDWETKTNSFSSLEPGVFICGLAHGPKQMRETVAQALAAAQHALILLSRPAIAANTAVARVEARRCAACLTCLRVCPYGVPRIEDPLPEPGKTRRRPVIDPARCQGCGTCVSACPGRAIQLDGFGDEQVLDGGILGRWLAAASADGDGGGHGG